MMEAVMTGLDNFPWRGGAARPRPETITPHKTTGVPASVAATPVIRPALEHSDYSVMSDEALMAALAAGQRAALEQIYDRYMNGCYGLALKIVRDPSLAEEIVQDVFLKLWSRPSSFTPERGKFSGWLLTLVHNRSIDKLRRGRAGVNGSSVPLDMNNGSGITLAETLPDSSTTPFEEAWRGEKGTLLRRALTHLPEAQRQAITMAYFGGLTQKEIAERLGEPLGTIKTRTRTGLLQLRRLLANKGLVGEAE
jgi:RNA polymerase sigma-70 factor, ECF subfamily